ncbi:dihydrolipoamide dehydrogenase [Christiangramia fulva]|uniref:Dihydrolipoamide dehydrogenase n=1 Tax=Christiangramia fulva TaxID=2126553 RepID=A0A2R3Z8Y0_9FLAO|nr:dihydrolipoamide dehydrogenase [Christiangramia fulva]AVR46723.1 dihydrolipoamide dehydrogenase [Christiangramia fulva]
MKKILSLLALTSILFISCTGDPGPPGPPGPPGEDGQYIVGQAFEATVDFTDPNYSVFVDIPAGIEVLDTDIVLVYLLESVDDQTGADVWSLLPQTFYLDGSGEVQYNYNHTSSDVNIYLHGNVDLSTLGPAFTDNQTFRLVVLPADYALNSGVDINNYQAVKAALDLKDANLPVAHSMDK